MFEMEELPYHALEAFKMVGAAQCADKGTFHLQLAFATFLHSRSQLWGRGGLDRLALQARLVGLLWEGGRSSEIA